MAEEHRRNRAAGKIDPGSLSSSLADMNNIQFWFKADSLGLNDNDYVSVWTDESGNYRDATQGTEASQPIFKTNVIGNLPACRFANDSLGHEAVQYSSSTWFVVWSRNSATANDVVMIYDAESYAYLQYSSLWYVYTSASTTVAMATGTFSLKSCVYDGVNYQRYTNGSAEASQVGTGPGEYRYIGSGFGVFGGDIAEIAIFDTNLSTADRQYVENYLNGKYSLW